MTDEQVVGHLRAGVRLLRTVYGSKADFAHAARQWVAEVEALLASLSEDPESASAPSVSEGTK